MLVQTLTLILITTPELAPLRSLLKGLRTNKAGQAFFESLYRSWSHNAVATLALCLLAQAYHHARDLVQILYAPRSRNEREVGWEAHIARTRYLVVHVQCRPGGHRHVLRRLGQARAATRVARLFLCGTILIQASVANCAR